MYRINMLWVCVWHFCRCQYICIHMSKFKPYVFCLHEVLTVRKGCLVFLSTLLSVSVWATSSCTDRVETFLFNQLCENTDTYYYLQFKVPGKNSLNIDLDQKMNSLCTNLGYDYFFFENFHGVVLPACLFSDKNHFTEGPFAEQFQVIKVAHCLWKEREDQ